MPRYLDGTVALVTGASSGIGEAAARALVASGAAVALAARRADRLAKLASEITAAGGRAIVCETDVTDPAQARAAVEETVSKLGRLDTVINNAGVMLLGTIENAPVEEWERMVHLNLLGLLYVFIAQQLQISLNEKPGLSGACRCLYDPRLRDVERLLALAPIGRPYSIWIIFCLRFRSDNE